MTSRHSYDPGQRCGACSLCADSPGLAYQPEHAWSYEAGVKRTLSGGAERVAARRDDGGNPVSFNELRAFGSPVVGSTG